jgi:hypothetical protein
LMYTLYNPDAQKQGLSATSLRDCSTNCRLGSSNGHSTI